MEDSRKLTDYALRLGNREYSWMMKLVGQVWTKLFQGCYTTDASVQIIDDGSSALF